jgi:hypothetical protein
VAPTPPLEDDLEKGRLLAKSEAADFTLPVLSFGRCLLGGCCVFEGAVLVLLGASEAMAAGAGLGATEDEAVEADGGLEVAARFVGDLAR